MYVFKGSVLRKNWYCKGKYWSKEEPQITKDIQFHIVNLRSQSSDYGCKSEEVDFLIVMNFSLYRSAPKGYPGSYWIKEFRKTEVYTMNNWNKPG